MFNYLKGVFVISAAVFASQSIAESVTLPKVKDRINLGIQAQYLRPANGDLDFAHSYYVLQSDKGVRLNFKNHSFNFPYSLGFRLNFSYLLVDNGIDFDLRYGRLNADNKQRLQRKSDSEVIETKATFLANQAYNIALNTFLASYIPDYDLKYVGGGDLTLNTVEAKATFTNDDIAATFGKRVNLSGLDTRFYGGLGYANLSEKTEINGYSTHEGYYYDNAFNYYDFQTSSRTKENTSNQFYGLGPVLGINGSYNIFDNVHLVANLEAAMYLGKLKSTYQGYQFNQFELFDEFGNEIAQGNNENVLRAPNINETRMVPKVSTSLGIKYAKPLNTNRAYSFEIEGGYELNSYFRAKERNVPGILYQERKTTNYTTDGAYLRFSLLAA